MRSEPMDSRVFTSCVVSFIGNSIPAILNMRVGTVYQDTDLCRLELRLVKEAVDFGQRIGVSLVPILGESPELVRGLIAHEHRFRQWGRFLGLPVSWYQTWVTKVMRPRYGDWSPLLEAIHEGQVCCPNNPHTTLIHQAVRHRIESPWLHLRLGQLLDQVFTDTSARAMYAINPDLFLKYMAARPRTKISIVD